MLEEGLDAVEVLRHGFAVPVREAQDAQPLGGPPQPVLELDAVLLSGAVAGFELLVAGHDPAAAVAHGEQLV
jgi:hypothetical protein